MTPADLAVAGGGPAGLAVAIHARLAGLSVVLLERQVAPPDKACGEGLMPAGLEALEAMGARALLDPSRCAPFRGILYAQAGSRPAVARFSRGEGLGVRRTALVEALAARARALGAELRRGELRTFAVLPDRVALDTDGGPLEARVLVGADGLHSPVRAAAGLALPAPPGPRRFGLRRHFALAPWGDLVEVHWAAGLECYVTPAGPELVNVAFLWDEPVRAQTGPAGFAALLARFPAVEERLRGAAPASEPRGAGPLLRPVRARAGERVALVGDAAGYVDAITGQGLTLAFRGAGELVRALPKPLEGKPLHAALRAYDRALRGAWRRYAWPAQALLWTARRPALRRALWSAASAAPGVFRAIVEGIAG